MRFACSNAWWSSRPPARAHGPDDGSDSDIRQDRRRTTKIFAIILILVGLVWTFQGLGVLGGSFMTGERQWLVIGIVVAVAGAVLLARTFKAGPRV